MNTTITKRDKVLLSAVGVVGILSFFLLVIIIPLKSARSAAKQMVTANEARIIQMEEKISRKDLVSQEYEEKSARLCQLHKLFYPMLKNQDMDRILLDKTREYGLTVKTMHIDLPEAPADVTVFQQPTEPGSNPGADPDGIYLADVSMRIQGSLSQIDQLIDDLALHIPGIWIDSLIWESAGVANGTEDSDAEGIMTITLKIGMYQTE